MSADRLFSYRDTEVSNTLEAMDFFKLQRVSDPQISPNGKQVAYVRTFADVKTDRFYSNVWIVDAEGKSDRQLTEGLFHDSEPRWSPDGKRLVFISDRNGDLQIYEYIFSEQGIRCLTDLKNAPYKLAWSPEGDRIAFFSFVPEAAPRYAEQLKQPEGAEWAKPARLVTQLPYRWDKLGYLDYGFSQLFVMHVVSGQVDQISKDSYHNGGHPATGVDAAPVWNPDGKSIFVSSNRHSDYELNPVDTEIYRFDIGNSAVTQLTDRRGPDESLAVSKDGQWIAYLGYQEQGWGDSVLKLSLMRSDGSESRVLLDTLDRGIVELSLRWSLDGQHVYFSYFSEGVTHLARVAIIDGTLEVLAAGLSENLSAYGNGSFSLANNGSYAATISSPNHIADIAVGADGVGLRTVTAINSVTLTGKNLGELEEFWYASELDGKKIQGWLLKPPGFEASKKYPLILEIHGGPQDHYGPGFDLEKQYMAARGYLVLIVNPRGSTSYGQEFINGIHHSFAGDEHKDFLSGIDSIVGRGIVDEKNIFVTGGSAGGLYTAWLVAITNRFRAAVSVYPVINCYSFALTTDLAAYSANNWFPGKPWERERHYMHRSPISIVDKVTTPTMLICGEDDYRTPISQSEEFFTALKLRGVETALVRFPEEPHGIRERPSHWLSKVEHILGWFEAHRR